MNTEEISDSMKKLVETFAEMNKEFSEQAARLQGVEDVPSKELLLLLTNNGRLNLSLAQFQIITTKNILMELDEINRKLGKSTLDPKVN
jgi:hypothetical protein